MTQEIRLYVEGGGEGKETRARFRQGFRQFLKDLENLARPRRIGWSIIACGSRNDAFRNFKLAMRDHPQAFNVLLVDSETAVPQSVWSHLQAQDHWDLHATDDNHCHLMVQVMEAWLIADVDTLAEFYRKGFNRKALPQNPNLEEIDKDHIFSSLKGATRRTTKGEYHKINHGPALLGLVKSSMVRTRASHCDRLFTILRNKIVE